MKAAVTEPVENEKEFLSKGVSLIVNQKDFSSAYQLFSTAKYNNIKDEIEIYTSASLKSLWLSNFSLGYQYFKEGSYVKSLDVFENMSETGLQTKFNLNSDIIYQKYNIHALCLLNLQNYEKGLEILQSVSMKSIISSTSDYQKRNAENLFNISIFYKNLNNKEESLKAMDECNELLLSINFFTSWLPLLYIEKSDIMIHHFQLYSKSIDFITEGITIFRDNNLKVSLNHLISLLLLRAFSYLQLTQFDKALDDIKMILSMPQEKNNEIPDNNNNILLQNANKLKLLCFEAKGDYFLSKNDYHIAIESYELALQTFTNQNLTKNVIFFKTILNLSIAYIKLGDNKLAEVELNKLIRLLSAEESSNIYNKYLCQAYIGLGQILVEKAKNLTPPVYVDETKEGNDFTAENSTNDEGLILQCEAYSLATEAFQSALKLDDKNISILYNLGVTQIKANSIDTAKDTFTKIIEMSPEHSNAKAGLDLCVLYENEMEKIRLAIAEKEAKELIEKNADINTKDNENIIIITPSSSSSPSVKEEESSSVLSKVADSDVLSKDTLEVKNASLISSPQRSKEVIKSFSPQRQIPTPDNSKASASPGFITSKGLKSNSITPTTYISSKNNYKTATLTSTSTSTPVKKVETIEKLSSTIQEKEKISEPSVAIGVETNGDVARVNELSKISLDVITRAQMMEYLLLLARVDAAGSNMGAYCYPYSALKAPGPFPPNVKNHRELYLSNDEFASVLKCTKDEFDKFPGWKQQSKKKAAGLF